jgi:hypothetical protein
MSNTALGRTETALLTNKSGGSLAQGDVVIVDTANAAAVTTTTTSAYVSGRIAVVLEPNGIANNAPGLFAFSGYVPIINLSGTGNIGDMVKTHTVAKQGVRHASPQVAGDFAQVLGTTATPAALLFGSVQLGGGTGAPADPEYVATASNATLSAEVVIPGLAGHADRAGVGGAGVSYEFDSGVSPLTWSAAVDVENVDSTVPSHLYIQDNGAAETLGTYAWSPAGAFDIRCKISLGGEVGTSANAPAAGLIVGDSAMNNRCLALLTYDGTNDRYFVNCFTYAASTYTQRGASQLYSPGCVYLRIVRDGSNNNSFYWSCDGLMWLLIATQALTYTCAKAGLRVSPNSLVANIAVDWIRSDV